MSRPTLTARRDDAPPVDAWELQMCAGELAKAIADRRAAKETFDLAVKNRDHAEILAAGRAQEIAIDRLAWCVDFADRDGVLEHLFRVAMGEGAK